MAAVFMSSTDADRTPAASACDPGAQVAGLVACVIPCFNEGLVLGETLASVLAAGVPPGDVLVIDDCSSDDTLLVAQRFQVRVLRNERNLGKSKSIARAIQVLRELGCHDFISILDADTLVDREYFATVVQAFAGDPEVVLVCGQPRSRRHNWLTAYRAVEYALAHGVYKPAQHKMGAITVAPGCASTYKLTLLEHLIWNPGILTEDADTTLQVYRKRLGRVVYERRAIVHTQDPATLGALRGQLSRWYTGLWQVAVYHRIPFGGQRVDAEFALISGEALLFSTLLLMMPLWLAGRPALAAYYLVFDQLLWFAFASGVAIQQRRVDVLVFAPLFIVPRILNCLTFLAAFVRVVVLGRSLDWFSPPRYVSQRGPVLPFPEKSDV